jgi:glycosyltransferase involved in cell wall biosynthesis
VNVVVVNDNAQVNGGAAKIAIMEALGMAQRGHRVYFLAAVLPIAADLLHPNITVVCSEQPDLLANPNPLQAFAQGWWNPKAGRLAKELFATLDPRDTVVHLHIWTRALSSSVVRAALDANLRCICTLHDFLLACPTGTLFLHDKQTICHLQPMSPACIATNCDTRSYPQKLWRVGRQAIQQHLGHAPSHLTHFIAHSQFARDIMAPYLSPSATIHPLTPYIESTQSSPATPAANENFVYLGRLVREKGVLMLARAAAAERLPLVFIGTGALEQDVASTYPEARITGWVDHAASLTHLRQARALVFPSLWYETLGLVVLEAAANGIPSIVADTSAAREIVLDGVTGLHFRGGDEQDLRAKMRQLQDPELAATLGRAAYDRFWSSDFASREAHLVALEAIYAKLL